MALLCNSETDNVITNCTIPIGAVASGLTLAKSTWIMRFMITAAQNGANISFFGQDSGTARPFRLRKSSSGTNIYQMFASIAGSVRGIGADFTLDLNTPYTVIFWHDSTVGTGKRQRVLVNGVEVAFANFAGTLDILAATTFKIGQTVTSVAGSNIDLAICENAMVEDALTDPQMLLLNTELAGMIGLGINWYHRYSYEDNASGNAVNGDLSLLNHEGTGNALVGTGTPKYDASYDPRVWIAGKDTSFVASEVVSAGSIGALEEFWNGESNILVFGDSYCQENWGARLPCAFFRTLDLTNGWMSYSVGATNNSGTGGEIGMNTSSGTYSGTKQARSANEPLFAASVYNHIPSSKTEYPLGTGFTPGTNNRTDRFSFTGVGTYALNEPFLSSETDLKTGIYTLKVPAQTFVEDAGFDESTGAASIFVDFTTDIDGYNYHDLSALTLTSSRFVYMYSTANWTTGTKWLMLAGIRGYKPSRGGNELLATFGQESWSTSGHENQKNILGGAVKEYTYDELRGFMQAVPDKTKPIWIILGIKQESTAPGEARVQLYNIKQKFKNAAIAEGCSFGGMIVVMPWCTDHTLTPGSAANLDDVRHAESLATYAARDALYGDGNVYCASIYGKTQGIYLDGSTQAALQAAIMADLGMDHVVSYDGTISDFSAKNFYDGTSNEHPADSESAFGFAYIVRGIMREDLNLDAGGNMVILRRRRR